MFDVIISTKYVL